MSFNGNLDSFVNSSDGAVLDTNSTATTPNDYPADANIPISNLDGGEELSSYDSEDGMSLSAHSSDFSSSGDGQGREDALPRNPIDLLREQAVQQEWEYFDPRGEMIHYGIPRLLSKVNMAIETSKALFRNSSGHLSRYWSSQITRLNELHAFPVANSSGATSSAIGGGLPNNVKSNFQYIMQKLKKIYLKSSEHQQLMRVLARDFVDYCPPQGLRETETQQLTDRMNIFIILREEVRVLKDECMNLIFDLLNTFRRCIAPNVQKELIQDLRKLIALNGEAFSSIEHCARLLNFSLKKQPDMISVSNDIRKLNDILVGSVVLWISDSEDADSFQE